MEYDIPAICRLHSNGTVFRSTLEAQWASMFDILNWDWKYEPEKFKNKYSGWTPDFCVNENVLVEVKPFSKEEEFNDIVRYIESTQNSRFENSEILLLGKSIFNYDNYPMIGWLLNSQMGMDIATFSHDKAMGYGFAGVYGNWKCKITDVNPQSEPEGASLLDLLFKWDVAGVMARNMPVTTCPAFN